MLGSSAFVRQKRSFTVAKESKSYSVVELLEPTVLIKRSLWNLCSLCTYVVLYRVRILVLDEKKFQDALLNIVLLLAYRIVLRVLAWKL